jgi:hypothetical protein
MLDTGSDVNLVTAGVLKDMTDMGLPPPILEDERHKLNQLMGLGASPVPILGSVQLSFRVDGKKKIYTEPFLVVPESSPPDFDLLFGKRWIRDHEALTRNRTVYLGRLFPRHSSHKAT